MESPVLQGLSDALHSLGVAAASGPSWPVLSAAEKGRLIYPLTRRLDVRFQG
jgi:hypothetical protein